jgi:hypothetical protein
MFCLGQFARALRRAPARRPDPRPSWDVELPGSRGRQTTFLGRAGAVHHLRAYNVATVVAVGLFDLRASRCMLPFAYCYWRSPTS